MLVSRSLRFGVVMVFSLACACDHPDRSPLTPDAGSHAGGDAASLDGRAACSELHGGALVTLGIQQETLAVWITRGDFLAQARTKIGETVGHVARFDLAHGPGCDPAWSWTVRPDTAMFVDLAAEVCDGLPSHIESNPAYWIDGLGYFCPWSARVISVVDRP